VENKQTNKQTNSQPDKQKYRHIDHNSLNIYQEWRNCFLNLWTDSWLSLLQKPGPPKENF